MPLPDTSYLIIIPGTRGDFQSEWDYCLTELSKASSSKENQLCRINIFINSDSEDDFRNRKFKIFSSLNKMFGNDTPPAGVLSQAPEDSYHVALELLMVKRSERGLRYGRTGKSRYCVFENDSLRQLWSEGLESGEPSGDTESGAQGAFESMKQILDKEGMNFDNIVRQWNYIGEILKEKKSGKSEIQNYQIFNEVRHSYYQKYKHASGFPAATGIGCRYNQVTIGFIAVQFKSSCSDIQIDNPLQVNPFAYSQDKLIGASEKQIVKHPPEFVRGRLISDGSNSILYVSGTASITCQEVTGAGDIETQTLTTILNIKTLAEAKNLNLFSARPLPIPGRYLYLRVYVKNTTDIPTVKSICQKHFPGVPSIFIEADICRGSLLMEIETELCS
jgi:enamine deaminase RidA (YjgF/YER057c/UK114 family)